MNQETHKLSAKHKMFVCTLLATGFNPEYVVQELKDQYGIEVTRDNIRQNYQHSPRWKRKIRQIAAVYEKNLLKHPLANKTNRLNYLLTALTEALTWRTDKIITDENGVVTQKIEKRQIRAIASLIREARIEIEGDTPLIDNSKHSSLEVKGNVFAGIPIGDVKSLVEAAKQQLKRNSEQGTNRVCKELAR